MKKTSLLACMLLLMNTIFGIDAGVSHAVFADGKTNYTEIYMHVLSESLHLSDIENGKQANLKIEIDFFENDKLIQSDGYNLLSPAFKTLETVQDLIDVRRYELPTGSFKAVIKMTDNNSEANIFEEILYIDVAPSIEKPFLSGIQLLSYYNKESGSTQFHKSGYYLATRAIPYYPAKDSTLSFYIEYYKPSADVTTDKLLLRYWIANAENENTPINDIGGTKKISTLDSTNAYLGILKIKNLYSGRYQLVVQILDKTMNELDRTSVTFFRNSPAPTAEAPVALEAPKNWEETLVAGTFVDSLDAASLQYSLEALQPLLRHADAGQLKEVTKGSDLTRKKAFLLAFWRRMGGTEAQSQWAGYMKVAKEVDKKFATVSYKGFTTDRGYVYLRYGKPSNVYSRDDNFNKLPFEMWEYMDIPGNQGAVDFVFINESLAPADFKLIHSTARGEVSNPNWRTELNRKQFGNKPNSSYLMDDNRRSNSIFED